MICKIIGGNGGDWRRRGEFGKTGPHEDAFVVRTFLVSAAVIIPKIMESQKKTRRLASAISFRDLFGVRDVSLLPKMPRSKPIICSTSDSPDSACPILTVD